jgi:hypothetical protein
MVFTYGYEEGYEMACLSEHPQVKKNNRAYLNPIIFLVLISLAVSFNIRAQDTVDATTLTGKYMCGYQGWFQCPGDGAGGGWFHWFNSQTPTHANLNTDVFPDFTEYTASELFPTQMHYADGSVVGLNSSYKVTTELRHFKWMKDYGIDGVWVQRFGPKHVGWNDFTNKVLLNCKQAAETYGRVFVVMYDVSGANNATLFNDLTSDWKYLVDTFKVTQSPRYLKHKGKPLVSVWGFGFSDRSITTDVAQNIIDWFKTGADPKYQATIMGGVNDDWRTTTTGWASVCRSVDIISPWFVGRFGDIVGADSWKTNHMVPDVAECKTLGKDYLPVIWPGFSWSNMHHGTTPQNQIPRLGGALFWEQAYNAVSSGATMLYNAMFDEVDEGTAILKACPKKSLAPSDGYWLTLDADGYNLPSDWYLRLAGYAKKMVTGQVPVSKTMPLNPNKPDSGVSVQLLNGPQPGRENIGISDLLPVSAQVELSLCRLNGEVVRQVRCGSADVAKRASLLTHDRVPNGVYLLRVNVGGRIAVAKLASIVQ